MNEEGERPPHRRKIGRLEHANRYWRLLLLLLLLGFYWYIFDFLYFGNVPSPLPTQDSGLLCKLEFENLKETYEGFHKFYFLLTNAGKNNADVYRAFSLEEKRDLICWRYGGCNGEKFRRDYALDPPSGARWRSLDAPSLKDLIFSDAEGEVNANWKHGRIIRDRKKALLDQYGLQRPVTELWQPSPLDLLRSSKDVFGQRNVVEQTVKCHGKHWYSFGVWPVMTVTDVVAHPDKNPDVVEEERNKIFADDFDLRPHPDLSDDTSQQGKNIEQENVKQDLELDISPDEDGVWRRINITAMARAFGLVIAVAFDVFVVYLMIVKRKELISYYCPKKHEQIFGHTCSLDFAVSAAVFFIGLRFLSSPLISIIATLPLLVLFVARWCAECRKDSLRRRYENAYAFQKFVRVLGNTAGTFFLPAGMIFPLIGILGTFLGLALALSDKGLLHILRTIGEGSSMPADEWAGLLKGVGAAVFASMFATFSAIMARFVGGCFGLERDEDEPLKVAVVSIPPHGSCAGSGKPSHPDGGDGPNGGNPPAGGSDPVVPVPPAPAVPPFGPAPGPAGGGSIDPQLSMKLDRIIEDTARVTRRIDDMATQVEALKVQAAKTDGTLVWAGGYAQRLLHALQNRARRLIERQPKFTRLTETLEKIQSRLNEGPVSMLDSIDRDRREGLADMKNLVEQARREFGGHAQDTLEQGTAMSAQLQRLIDASSRLEAGAKLLTELQQAATQRKNTRTKKAPEPKPKEGGSS